MNFPEYDIEDLAEFLKLSRDIVELAGDLADQKEAKSKAQHNIDNVELELIDRYGYDQLNDILGEYGMEDLVAGIIARDQIRKESPSKAEINKLIKEYYGVMVK